MDLSQAMNTSSAFSGPTIEVVPRFIVNGVPAKRSHLSLGKTLMHFYTFTVSEKLGSGKSENSKLA